MRSRPRSVAPACRRNSRTACTRASEPHRSDPLRVDGPIAPDLACVHGPLRLEEEDMDLVFRDGTVLHAPRDHRDLARAETQGPAGKFDPEVSVNNEEEFVLKIVMVPDELALQLDKLHVGLVELRDDLRFPIFLDPTEFLLQVHDLR